ncbi:polymyxin resistance protein B [Shigella boydii]|nr:polymyxin resistance protein B [Shigella boydii]
MEWLVKKSCCNKRKRAARTVWSESDELDKVVSTK